MIFVNFKTYKEALGREAVTLAHIICDVAGETGTEIISCPQAVDLREVVKSSDHPVWVQHVDSAKLGKTTGWRPAEAAKAAGAIGTLINHSEHKLTLGVLGETLTRCKGVGLKTLVFADSIKEVALVAELEPDYIGYEPPELVGSRTISVATAKPEIIKAVVKTVKPLPVIVGAGVHDPQDVKVSLQLGAKGIAVATDVVLAKDSKKELKELAEAFLQ